MGEIWDKIQNDPESYQDQNISVLLENSIQNTTYELVEEFSDKWQINEDELEFMVSNYNPRRSKQDGKAELKRTSNYEVYKQKVEKPVSKLKYWKHVRKDLDDLMKEEILLLQNRK
ncbi:hypothetical protein NRIC_21450 [Enterococcus florum]|uniref:Uncharacterized protein n=1 Tax=Enterococcus florum TaxID=2480627 RepID=A0A4P5PCL6_9ENTE|nr:hypothetical protein [Enterococcus florum]GCF94254.1 hypothetical protein NRIC_21450 [Enterococcus florum]